MGACGHRKEFAVPWVFVYFLRDATGADGVVICPFAWSRSCAIGDKLPLDLPRLHFPDRQYVKSHRFVLCGHRRHNVSDGLDLGQYTDSHARSGPDGALVISNSSQNPQDVAKYRKARITFTLSICITAPNAERSVETSEQHSRS